MSTNPAGTITSGLPAPTVHVASLGDVYARITGVNCVTWTELDSPLPKDHTSIDRYITTMPFAIGRSKTTDFDAKDSSWLLVSGGIISRKHAVIRFDEEEGVYKIKCFSPNGIDVNRELRLNAANKNYAEIPIYLGDSTVVHTT